MHYSFFISDPHLGHENILKFKDDDGKFIRSGFSSIEEHDNLIIENINKKARIQDKLYILGDVAIKKNFLCLLDKINTKKLVLIKGNHDIYQLKDYLPYFKDIRSYKMMPKHGIIFSHIPVHPDSLEGRFNRNVHGHIHHRKIDNKKYLNICPERVGYEPLELEEILEKLNEQQ